MKTLLILLIAAALGGCQVRTIKTAGGSSYTSVSIGTDQSVGAMEIETKDGTKVRVEGYKSEGAQIAASAVEAGIAAGLKAAKATASP